MEEFDFTKASFQDVLDYTAGQIGGEFEKSILIAQDIIDNPTNYSGPQAASTALKLATYRLLVGTNAEYFKLRTQKTQKFSDKLTKGALIVMYDALEELINCLKLVSRLEAGALNGR